MKKEQILNAIYEDGGLYDRIIDRINELGTKQVCAKLNKWPNSISFFKSPENKRNRKVKLSTIMEYADKLEVD